MVQNYVTGGGLSKTFFSKKLKNAVLRRNVTPARLRLFSSVFFVPLCHTRAWKPFTPNPPQTFEPFFRSFYILFSLPPVFPVLHITHRRPASLGLTIWCSGAQGGIFLLCLRLGRLFLRDTPSVMSILFPFSPSLSSCK